MGRWSHLDTDEKRLRQGMKCVGYDADTQTYTILDTSDLTYWEIAPGAGTGSCFDLIGETAEKRQAAQDDAESDPKERWGRLGDDLESLIQDPKL